jgi:hypothetical protein
VLQGEASAYPSLGALVDRAKSTALLICPLTVPVELPGASFAAETSPAAAALDDLAPPLADDDDDDYEEPAAAGHRLAQLLEASLCDVLGSR